MAFVQEKGTFKGANKDLWSMVCTFSVPSMLGVSDVLPDAGVLSVCETRSGKLRS
jgi:hypothetical protein